jgi:hypothetical protein
MDRTVALRSGLWSTPEYQLSIDQQKHNVLKEYVRTQEYSRSTSGLRRDHSVSRDGKKEKQSLACISEILHQSKGTDTQHLKTCATS